MQPPASKRPLCAAHGLSAGPDGQCVLCKRPAVAVADVSESEASLGARLLNWLLAALALSGVAALWFLWTSAPSPGAILEAPDEAPVERAPPRGPAARQKAEQDTAIDPQPQPQPGAAEQAPLEQETSQPAADQRLDTDAQQRRYAEQRRAAVEAAAEQARRVREGLEAERRDQALSRARQDVRVVMYGTTWCPSCQKARAYMDERRIPYVAHDIDQDPSARTAMKRLNPRGSVPTIDVEGELMIGFGAGKLEHMIDSAARKRVRL